MENKFKLKKFLATASAFAMITSSSSAMGAQITDNNGGDVIIGGGADANTNGVLGDGDSFHFSNAGHALATGGAITINAIDLNGKAPGVFTVAHNTTVGPVVDTGGVNTLNVTVNDVRSLTLANNAGVNAANDAIAAGTFTGLGDVVLGSGGGGSDLVIDSDATLAGTINSDGAANGVVIVNAGKTVVFNGILGTTNTLGKVQLVGAASKATFNANVTADVIILDHATAEATIGDNVTVTGQVDAVNEGKLNFAGSATVTGDIGATKNLNLIKLAGDANSNVIMKGNVSATTTTIGAGKLQLDTGKTITGDVEAATANTGVLHFDAIGTVTGTIGEDGKALKLVQVTGAGDVDLSANAHHAKTFNLQNNNAKLKVAANGSLVGDLVANGAGNGQVEFAAAGEIKGKIGDANGNAFGAVIANGAGAVTINTGDHKVTILKAANAGSSFVFKDGANITGAIDNSTANAGNTALTFEGTSTVTGAIGATIDFKDINIAKGALTTKADVKALNINFTDADEGKLIINGAANQKIGSANGLIQQQADSRGEIVIGAGVAANNVTFLSKIGNSGDAKALKLLDIQNNNAGSIITVAGDSHITEIRAAGESKLSLAAGDHKIGAINAAVTDKLALNIDADVKLINVKGAGNTVDFGTTTNRLGTISFKGNNTLTIEDGVNIVASGIDTGAADRGTLTFEGSSIFNAATTGNSLNQIKVDGGAGKTVKITKNIVVANDVLLAAGSTLELGGNITANNIQGKAADNQGTLRFVNEAASTVTGTVGAVNKLLAIEFGGSDVSFAGNVTHAGDYKFDAKNATKVTFNAATNVGGNNFVNASADAGVNHTVVLKNNTVFTGAVAKDTAATNQIIFQLDNAKNAQINAADASGAIFSTGTDGKGGLEFINANAVDVVHSAGQTGKTLENVIFMQSGEITNGVMAQNVAVVAGKTARLGGEVYGPNFTLANVGSTVQFLDGVKVNTVVNATVADKGNVEFLGGGSVESGKTLGVDVANRVNNVTFSDDATKMLALNANIFANKVTLKKGSVQAASDIAIDSPVVDATNAAIYLGGNDITVNGGVLTFSGEGKIDVAVAQSGNVISGGKVITGTGSTLKFAAGTKLAITPNDATSTRPTGGASREMTVIDNKTGNAVLAADMLDLTNVSIDSSKNPFTKWTSKLDANGGLVLIQSDGAADKITEILGGDLDGVDSANVKLLTEAAAGTDAAKFVDVLASLVSDEDKLDEALERLTTITTATDAIEGTMGNVSNDLGARLGHLGGVQSAGTPVQSGTVRKTASSAITGVAAGDDHARYGAWFNPFYSKTTQKARKGAAGYRDTTYGGSFGLDTRANDDLIIGGAFTFANSEMKHRDQKSGDKTKVNSLMFSIYAMQQITDTWFAQASATIGSNDVKNLEKRVSGLTTFDGVEGKYSSMSFNGEALFGYNYATEDFTLTPMGGLRYTRVNSAGYKETGSTTGQNLDISQKASNKLDVVVGARVSGGTFDVNGMSVTPELHGFINHDIIGKNPKQSQRIGGANGSLTAKSRKPIKTTYNLGLGVNADYGMMEYGVGYDVHLAEKRVGHEGSLKIRVNF